MAQNPQIKMMLNAGRGNPNWVAVYPRKTLFSLTVSHVECAAELIEKIVQTIWLGKKT